MKNIVISLVVLLAAIFIYQLTQRESTNQTGPDSTAKQEVVTAPDSEPVAKSNPLSSDAADNARVFILEPADGANLKSPIKVVFGIENMAIVPAGQNQPNSGHHHLLVDLSELPALDVPLPANDNVIHFGKGQTETTIELEPGDHSLQLLLGNYLHVPHNKAVFSDRIIINVIE